MLQSTLRFIHLLLFEDVRVFATAHRPRAGRRAGKGSGAGSGERKGERRVSYARDEHVPVHCELLRRLSCSCFVGKLSAKSKASYYDSMFMYLRRLRTFVLASVRNVPYLMRVLVLPNCHTLMSMHPH